MIKEKQYYIDRSKKNLAIVAMKVSRVKQTVEGNSSTGKTFKVDLNHALEKYEEIPNYDTKETLKEVGLSKDDMFYELSNRKIIWKPHLVDSKTGRIVMYNYALSWKTNSMVRFITPAELQKNFIKAFN